jgi:serine/threonine protein kinase
VPEPSLIGSTVAHYKILSKLGEGAMGKVYLAEDGKLGRQVALKVPPADLAADPQRLARYEREARAVAALNHPNIVTLHSIEESDGLRFLTMELVQGQNLAQSLTREGLPLDRLLELAIPITSALSAAHDTGIVHRDLKPENIMVNDQGQVKILDFGLAKLRESDAAGLNQTLTQEGMVFGTVPYMSPEQVQGQPADARSDIFSLGVILYEMATGQRPFKGESSAHVISSILRDTPISVTDLKADLPNHLGRLVRHCGAPVPDRQRRALRPGGAQARSRCLVGALQGRGPVGTGSANAGAGDPGACSEAPDPSDAALRRHGSAGRPRRAVLHPRPEARNRPHPRSGGGAE